MFSKSEMVNSFQMCTGITDEVLAILYLEETDWNLVKALKRVTCSKLKEAYPKKDNKSITQRQEQKLASTSSEVEDSPLVKKRRKLVKKKVMKRKATQTRKRALQRRTKNKSSQTNSSLCRLRPFGLLEMNINLNNQVYNIIIQDNLTLQHLKLIIKNKSTDINQYNHFLEVCSRTGLSDSDELFELFKNGNDLYFE